MIEYEPMEQPRRVSFTRMQEILKRRCSEATNRIEQLKKEMWFVDRLKAKGVFTGDTTPTVRAARVRDILKKNLLSEKRCGMRAGAPVTYAQMFSELYGEPL